VVTRGIGRRQEGRAGAWATPRGHYSGGVNPAQCWIGLRHVPKTCYRPVTRKSIFREFFREFLGKITGKVGTCCHYRSSWRLISQGSVPNPQEETSRNFFPGPSGFHEFAGFYANHPVKVDLIPRVRKGQGFGGVPDSATFQLAPGCSGKHAHILFGSSATLKQKAYELALAQLSKN